MDYDDLPENIGRFKVNRSLTLAFNYTKYGYWLIYRDDDLGLFAYNEDLDENADLFTWMTSVKDVKEDPTIFEKWKYYIDLKLEELKNLGVIK